MIECFACGTNFTVTFDDDGTDLNFCPHCGQETVDEIDILDDFTDPSIFDDDEN